MVLICWRNTKGLASQHIALSKGFLPDACPKEFAIRLLAECEARHSIPSVLPFRMLPSCMQEAMPSFCINQGVIHVPSPSMLGSGWLRLKLHAVCRSGPDRPDSYSASYYAAGKTWTAPFIMAPCNTRVVRRSQHLLGHPFGRHAILCCVVGCGDELCGKL